MTSLFDVYRVYKKWYHIEDKRRIDAVLAVAASQKIDDGIPLWLILVGASGDMKSVQINALREFNAYVLHNLTSKSLVNGYKDKKKFPDLAPQLDKKILLIPDMAQILKLPPIEKGELWGQLRDLYDGFAGKVSGMGSSKRYQDLKVTLIAASTPAIDAQILVHQDLGTRELIYRTEGNEKKKELMSSCSINEQNEDAAKTELRDVTQQFLEEVEITTAAPSPASLEIIEHMALYVTYMRATAEYDNYTNELRNFVYPEEPTRIFKQLKRMFTCLMSLDQNYPEKRALEICWHIAQSSAFPIRIKVFDLLQANAGELSTSQVAENLFIGKGTAKRDLLVLEALKLVTCRREPISNFSDKCYEYWTAAKPSEEIVPIYNIPLKIKNFIIYYTILSDGFKTFTPPPCGSIECCASCGGNDAFIIDGAKRLCTDCYHAQQEVSSC